MEGVCSAFSCSAGTLPEMTDEHSLKVPVTQHAEVVTCVEYMVRSSLDPAL